MAQRCRRPFTRRAPGRAPDLLDHLSRLEVRRVDLDRIVGPMGVCRVSLVSPAQLVGEHLGRDPVPLGVPALARTSGSASSQILSAACGRHDDSDVPTLDHRVAQLAEGTLALRITSRTSGCRATTGTEASISGSRISAVTSCAADRQRRRRRRTRPDAARQLGERGRRRADPAAAQARSSARYIAPVSR